MTPSVSPLQIADVLATNLETVFDGLCEDRYGGSLSLERSDPPAPVSSTARFHLYRGDLLELRVDFEIRHVGGNVYDVHGRADGGPSQTFTYCLPDSSPPAVPRAPRLAGKVAAFLLDVLERRLGSDQLRNEIRARRTTSPPRRSGDRARSSTGP